MPDAPKLQPAIYGGVFIGVLSALPIVGWFNACCCLWVVSGGALALWLSQSNHPYPVKASDGALIGLLAGFIGGLVAIPLNLVFEPLQRQMLLRFLDSVQADVPPQVRAMFESRPSGVLAVLSGLVTSCIYAVFAMLGGLLGVAIFKKDAPPPPPPGTIDVYAPPPPPL